MKRLVAVIVAVFAGAILALVAVAAFLRNDFDETDRADLAASSRVRTDASRQMDERIARLESTIDDVFDRLEKLQVALQTLQSSQSSVTVEPDRGASSERLAPAAAVRAAHDALVSGELFSADSMTRRNLQRLACEGFGRERAEWIMQRAEQLQLAAIETQFEAKRGDDGGQPNSVVGASSRGLRVDLDDAEYERYRRAMGLSTESRVGEVTQGSAAARAGILPGDAIVFYDGKRVFELAEINDLARQGVQGSPVAIDVIRGGLATQLLGPRGPFGIVEASRARVRRDAVGLQCATRFPEVVR